MAIYTVLEILFVISFIVFFAFGYYVGSKKKKIKAPVENCSHSYAQGLNYLLANESDKAIQLFVDLIKVDGETAETHLALGKLFRSKGEVDKAIKIHLNILAKPSLDVPQRIQVLFELASDYQKAGLLDRAENVFKELLELDKKNISALTHLQNMYIAEKSWLQAIVYAEILIGLNVKDSQDILAHCYCELAQSKAEKKEFHLAKQYLQLAIEAQKECVRALILRFKIESDEHNVKVANKTLNHLMKEHISHIDLFIEDIYTFYKRSERLNDYPEILNKYNADLKNKIINVALLRYYFNVADFSSGYDLLNRILALQSDLDIYEIAFKHLSIEQFGFDKYERLHAYIEAFNKKRAHYNCHHCGYDSHSMHWQCPSCSTWSSMRIKESPSIQ